MNNRKRPGFGFNDDPHMAETLVAVGKGARHIAPETAGVALKENVAGRSGVGKILKVGRRRFAARRNLIA